jgi:hypothetical protein
MKKHQKNTGGHRRADNARHMGPMRALTGSWQGCISGFLLQPPGGHGTAETPAAPMSGLTLPPLVLYMILPNSTPRLCRC